MNIQQTTEEQLKTAIYNIYTLFFNESSSDRQQVYSGQIWEKIVFWYNCYGFLKLKIEANEMGVEIYNVIKRLTKDNNRTAKDKSEFFNILIKALKNAENEYYHIFEQGKINIPREKKRKLREVEDFIRMKESQLRRKLTVDEHSQSISKWFKKQEYVDLLNVKYVDSILHTIIDENDEIDDLNSITTLSIDPQDEYIKRTDMETVLETFREAVKSVLAEKQERARDCYKALFTLYCIENDLRGLYPILDQEIIDFYYKDGIIPNQYEIYLKYHPNAKESSAGAMASTNLKDFIKEIKAYLKNKN